MKRILLALFCAAGTMFFTPSVAVAQDREAPSVPQPELVTSSWKLTFTHDIPRTIAIQMPDGTVLLDTYHVSLRNTNSGRLTADMLDAVLLRARELAGL